MVQEALELLDRSESLLSRDPMEMHRLLAQFPEMLLGEENPGPLPLPPQTSTRFLLVTGMGGSGIVGDILVEEVQPSGVFGLSVKDYHLPRTIPEGAFCLCISYSGNTEETLSTYKECRERNIPCAVITSGGKLADLAKSDHIAHFTLPGNLPPRAALPSLLAAAFRFLSWLRITPNTSALAEVVTFLQKKKPLYLPETPVAHNLAKQISIKLIGKIPIMAGAAGVGRVAALRWKAQLNENSKISAFDFVFPEGNHNAVVPLGEMRKGEFPFVMVFLRDSGDSPRMTKRIDVTKSLIATHLDGAIDVWSEGTTLLMRLLSLIFLGDYVSLYLALVRGVDPTPVAPIDRLKRELSR